jgi:hypothetical protein
LSTRLERYAWMTIAVVALSVAILAMLSDVAAAQEEATNGAPPRQVEQNAYDESTYESTDSAADRRRVVTPGDSLWSIAQEQLGPNAAPEWVANEVERIHWDNRDRIGEDPNLILVGQELTLLPATSEPLAVEPDPIETVASEPVAVEPEPVKPEPVESVTSEASEEPAAAEGPSEAPSEGPSEASAEASAEPYVVLPEVPEADAELVSASVQVPSATPERDGDARRKAGYAVLLFTFAVALLGTAMLLSKRHRAYR